MATTVVFIESPAMPGWGDIEFEDEDLGWNERSKAEELADQYGVELVVQVGRAPEYSENRKGEDDADARG